MKKISLEIRKSENRHILDTWTFNSGNVYSALKSVYRWKQMDSSDKGPSNPEDFPDIVLTEQLTTWYD